MKITQSPAKPRPRNRARTVASTSAFGTIAAMLLSGVAVTPALADAAGESIGTGTNSNDFSPSLTVAPGNELEAVGETLLELTGSGYATHTASNTNFGGAYILFGVITPSDASDPGSWAPSKQGVSGVNYDYAPGAGTNQTMVNYPGNQTEPDVSDMDEHGNWSGQLLIPGASFTSQAGKQIDCFVQQCGVITVGAHGQAQGGVEVFTPVTFAQAATIITQPADQSVTEGENATFSVEATGTPAPTYQWQQRLGGEGDFADIDGATEASYTVTAVQGAATGTQYQVVVTNAGATVTSAAATLTVNPPATETTTTLAAQATSSYTTDFAGEDIDLSATVAPAASTGSVEFFDGETSLGTSAVTAGSATLTTDALTGGAHQVKAVFTPADVAQTQVSESAARTYRMVDLTPAVPAFTLGTKTKSITGGTLDWSVANWVSFGSGPAKAVVSGDAQLAELPDGASVEDRANRNFEFTQGQGFEDAAGNRAVSFTGVIELTSGTYPRWTFTDPTLHIAANGDGYITADVKTEHRLSADGDGQEDEVREAGRIVVTTFTGGDVTVSGASVALAATPTFEGQTAAGTWSGDFTGTTLTNQFLQHVNSGVRSFLVQSGTTGSNLTKPGKPIAADFETADIAAPEIQVSPTAPLKRAGSDVTVTGTGIDATPTVSWGAQGAAGLYVSIGWIAKDGWKPSENAASNTRVAVATRAVQETEDSGDYVKWERDANDRASFSFVFPGVSYADVMAKKPASGDYRLAVYAIGAGGVKQAFNEFAADVTFEAEAVKPNPKPEPEPENPKPAKPTPVKVPFTDVKQGDKFFKEISWMFSSKLSTGIKQGNNVVYAPKLNMTREAMAAFLYRLEGASYQGPAVSPFADVKQGDKFYNEIAWMHKQGLSTGIKQATGKPAYAAKATVSREAMAAFVYRLENANYKGTKNSPFADVKQGDKFFNEIAWMHKQGLSTGIKQQTGNPVYAPKSTVTREAMAAFIYRLKN